MNPRPVYQTDPDGTVHVNATHDDCNDDYTAHSETDTRPDFWGDETTWL